ncbi:cupin-like domain-containing protein [Alteromonas sp. ASW11-36]|uniref:Cupin-like domain-containing protein n=1 Tax=Alteromonas arenosi TaxID=3055817 RepID=A0ABT7SW34_9ALTE|nr:cupin-like domain-containing protein [Alteromonas sp. ASW11-36]MDM7860392.1 cupin-like domain-containing protein [Alteromonas sp. ASW11-36]
MDSVTSTEFGAPMAELACSSGIVPEGVLNGAEPVVLRGLVAHWPIVHAANESNRAAVDYLTRFYNGKPVNAFLATPEANGRIFYNETVDGFNFAQSQVYLDDALNKIIDVADQPNQPTYYVGSLEIPQHLPGFDAENALDLGQTSVREGIWLGNQSVVAPHFDFPDNIACCIIGERTFTLFPPEQQANLYVGPLDFTPAGQPISMVDMNNPDLDRFPRFAEAMNAAITVTLKPGDAIFVPSMWWHSVASKSALNGLVNYWWRSTPAYLGVPTNALLHAILSIKYLPKEQREAWQALFNHYVFEQPDDMYDHLPAPVKQKQNQMSELTARKLKALLSSKLK